MAQKKRIKLSKNLIKTASAMNVKKLKMDVNPRNRRLKFMNFIEEIATILKQYVATEHQGFIVSK